MTTGLVTMITPAITAVTMTVATIGVAITAAAITTTTVPITMRVRATAADSPVPAVAVPVGVDGAIDIIRASLVAVASRADARQRPPPPVVGTVDTPLQWPCRRRRFFARGLVAVCSGHRSACSGVRALPLPTLRRGVGVARVIYTHLVHLEAAVTGWPLLLTFDLPPPTGQAAQ